METIIRVALCKHFLSGRVWGICLLLFVWCSLLQAETTPPAGAEEESPKKILVLSSYHLSHIWSHEAYNYLLSGFKNQEDVNEIDCFELSSIEGERRESEKDWEDFSSMLAFKEYDVLVTLLEDAADFVLQHYEKLPPQLPIFLCGGRVLEPDFQKTHPNITGIVGDSGILDNAKLGLKLMPKTQEILIATDKASLQSDAGQRLGEELRSLTSCKISIFCESDISTQELLEKVEKLPKNSFVIFANWNRYLQDGYHSLRKVGREIGARCSCPYLMVSGELFGTGTLGGCISSPSQQGELMVEMLEKILFSPNHPRIPLVEKPLTCMIDESVLISAGLDRKLLPADAVLFNKLPTFWSHYTREIIFSFIIIGLILALITQVHLMHVRLKKESRRINNILDALPVRIVISTLKGKILFFQVEKEFRNTFSSTVDNVHDLPGLNANRIMESIDKIAQGQKQVIVYYNHSGQKRMAVHFPVEKDVYGEEAVMWVSQDVSELEAQRNRLEELEEQQRVTLESIGDGLVATDEEGHVTFLNHVAAALTGYTLEEARGRAIEEVFQIISYTSGKPVASPVREVLATGKTVKLANHTDLISKGGTHYHVADSAAPIRGKDQHIKGVVLVFRDVTQEYEQRDRNRNSLQTLRYATRLANISYFRFKESLEKTPFDSNNEISNWLRDDNGDIIPPEEWVYKDDYKQFRRALLSLKNKEVQEIQFSYRSNYKGKMRYYNIMAARQEALSEQEEGEIFGVIQDVTNVSESQRKFNDANALLRKVIDTLPCPLFVKDASNGFRYEMANQNFAEKIVQVSQEGIIGKTDFEIFIDQKMAQGFREDDEKTLRINAPYSFIEKVGDHFIKTVKTTFETSDHRKLLIGFGMDVTEVEKAKHKEEESRLVLQSILDNLPCAIVVKDVDNDLRYVIWNRELEKQTGILSSHVIGKNDKEISPFPENTESFIDWDQRLIQSGKTAVYTEWCKVPQGKEIIYKTSKVLLKTESGRRYIIVMSLDVTRQTVLEEERLNMIERLNNHLDNGRIINQCLQKVIVNEDINQVINEMLSIIGQKLHADRSYIFKYDFEEDYYQNKFVWAQKGISSQLKDLDRITVDDLSELHVQLLQKNDYILKDLQGGSEHIGPRAKLLFEKQKICSLIITGIWIDEKLWGFLGLDYVKEKHDFSESDIRTLHDTSTIFQLSYERRRMTDDLNNYIANERIINKCLQKAVLENDYASVSHFILETVGKSVMATHCFVMQYDADHTHYSALFEWATEGAPRRTDQMQNLLVETAGVETVEILKRHEDMEILDVEDPPRDLRKLASMAQTLNIKSLFITGIWVDQKLWGFLGVSSMEKKNQFSRSDVQTVRGVANIFHLAYERNRQMKLIAESAHFQNQVFENISVPVVVMDKQKKILIANESCSAMLNVPLKEIVGAKCSKFFCQHSQEQPCLAEKCPLQKVYETAQKDIRSMSWRDKYIQAFVQPIFDLSGNVHYVLGSLIDLTEVHEKQHRLEKAMVQAQSSERAKSTFLATMSHEIRTPLNAIIGFSDVLGNLKATPEEQNDYIASINLAGKTLLNLINDVLDLSKIEADQMTITPTKINFVTLVEEICSIFRHRAKEKNLTLKLTYPTPMPMFYLDGFRLRQVLLNLLGNAVKFTNEGGIQVQVRFDLLDEKTANLHIAVMDTGIGISEEFKKTVFEPFIRQVDSVRGAKVYEGTGLGLPITQRLVKKMGGDISLSSQEGKGSTFTVHLKKVACDFSKEPLPDEVHSAQKATFRPDLNLLIVDDVPMNLKVLSTIFKKLGVACVSAKSGQEALNQVKKEHFDAVLTDMWMPGMNGEELARAIRNLPRGKEIKIYAITADTEASIDFNLIEFDGVLHKPLVSEKLRALLCDL